MRWLRLITLALSLASLSASRPARAVDDPAGEAQARRTLQTMRHLVKTHADRKLGFSEEKYAGMETLLDTLAEEVRGNAELETLAETTRNEVLASYLNTLKGIYRIAPAPRKPATPAVAPRPAATPKAPARKPPPPKPKPPVVYYYYELPPPPPSGSGYGPSYGVPSPH